MALLARSTPVLAIAFLLLACSRAPADEVLVLHTADGYGYFDDCGCRADSTGGLAKRSWVVDSLRANAESPILLVDAGDFTGSDNAYGAALGRVMFEAMELMGYDAVVFGEWDLNQGTAYLKELLTDTPIAWIHTNYEVIGMEDLGHKSLVIARGGRRIGLLGLYNPSILLDPAMADSIVVEDIVERVRAEVSALQGEGVDAIVALSHLGYRGDRALAGEVSEIDLIVSGHGGKKLTGEDQVMPTTWVVASGDLGRYLGRASLQFDDTPGSSALADVDAELIAMTPEVPDDPRLAPLFERYEAERMELMRSELDSMAATSLESP